MDRATQQAPLEWSADLMQLYVDQGERLAAVAWRILRRHDLAEEAVQDAFVHYHQRGCSPQAGKELAYLRVMVANNARMTIRQQARFLLRGDFECEPLEEGTCADPSPDDVCIAQIDATAVHEALRTLSSRQAEVMKLRYLHHMSEYEIAVHLQISQGSVKTHASRARYVLRQELRGCA